MPIAGYRLSEPVGYWNALGLLPRSVSSWHSVSLHEASDSASGSRRGRQPFPSRSRCYFTFSRGAWIALAIGIVAALLLDPRRLQLGLTMAIVAPWPALAVLLASIIRPADGERRPHARRGRRGRAHRRRRGRRPRARRRGAVTLVAAFEPRVRPSSAVRRIGNVAAVGGAVVLVARGARARGAVCDCEVVRRRHDGRRGRLERTPLQPVGQRSRRTVAGCARRRFRESGASDPVQGASRGTGSSIVPARGRSGTRTPLHRDARGARAGRARADPGGVRLPTRPGRAGRRRPLVPIAAAVLVAYLARAAIDWDWEFPVLTLVALACASVIVAEAERRQAIRFAGVV